MKRVCLVAIALAGWSGGAEAASWTVDAAKSRLGFAGTAAGAGFEGAFERWRAEIAFDPADPGAGRVAVSIETASAKTGDLQKDGALPQPEWFDAAGHPEARFEAAGFRATGDHGYQAAGTLTLRGVTKPVTLPFRFEESAGGAGRFRGKIELDRTEFGVGQGVWSGGQLVGTAVTVEFDLTAVGAGAVTRAGAP